MYMGMRSAHNQPKGIRKRSKVSKACENCRRRKIKCTGQQPCNNCVTYQCECVYKRGGMLAGSASLPSSAEKLAATISSENSTESVVSEGEKAGDTKGRCKNASEAVFDPVPDCVFDSGDCMGGQVTESKLSSATAEREQLGASGADEANYSEPAGPCKTNLGAMESYHPVEGDNGLYGDDSEFQTKISELQSVLKKLAAMRSSNPRVRRAIAELNEQAESLIENWEPEFNCGKYYESRKNGFERSKSVETHLMKNKYSDQVFLTTYSVWTDVSKKNNSENPFFGSQPLIDEIFGLYSPMQGLSLRGIGFFFQKCTSGSKSKEEMIQLKESLYLLLRFFDICLDQMNQSCVSIANPLESYIQRRNLMGYVPISTTPGVSPSSSNNRDLTSVVIDRLPQPFVERLTGVSNEQLRQVMYDDFAMFNLVLKMYNQHKNSFESLLMRTTRRQTKDSPTGECSPSDRENFIHFCEEEELLLALCYNYYNSTMYHVNEFVANLSYFEALLSLLEIQKWLDEFYGFDKVLGVALRYAHDIGLSRWEYYVGLDEETAERRRKCWWKLYTMEKLHSFKKGKQSAIDDDKMNCLFPSTLRNLGFSDNRDFLSKVLTTPRSRAFDNMSIQDLMFYGQCAISQVVSQFYSTVLFSERYTSIKNTAKPAFVKERLVNEVFHKLYDLRSSFDAIKEQTKKLFEIASSSTDGLYIAKDERSLAARLLMDTSSPSTINHYTEYAFFLRQSWRDMTQLVLSLDDDYTVSRIFESYGVVCLPLLSRAFCDTSFARTSDDVVLLLRVFRRLQAISIFQENKNNQYVASSKAYHIFVRFFTFLAINIHSMMLGHMRLNSITKDKLFEDIRQMAPDVADLPPLILDPKSSVYEPLLKPVQTSGFHLKVCSMLEKDGMYNKTPKAYPKTAHQLMPISSIEMAPVGPFGSAGDILSPRQIGSRESPCPAMPSIKTLTDVQGLSGTTQVDEKPSLVDSQRLNKISSPGQERLQNPSPGNLGYQYNGYNLGTLDEFINNGDLNDLCNTLWSDLYSEDVPQTILIPGDFSGPGDK